jgi:hypothetical protein
VAPQTWGRPVAGREPRAQERAGPGDENDAGQAARGALVPVAEASGVLGGRAFHLSGLALCDLTPASERNLESAAAACKEQSRILREKA